MGNLFSGKKDYQPVFGTGESLIRPVGDVPGVVARLAKSFRDDQGQPVLTENHWIYTGSGNGNILDQARFGRTIGADLIHRDSLDRKVSATDRGYTSLAYRPSTQDIGVYLTVFPTKKSETGVVDAETKFISNRGHLILDRPLASYLTPEYQRQLAAAFPGGIERLTNDQLTQFISGHPDKMGMLYMNGNGPETMAYLPDSVDVDIFATESSYHPTRRFYEQMAENKYEDGELIVDGHTHRALTREHVGNDAGLAALSQRFGPVKGAAVLSLSDAQTITEMKRASRAYQFKKTDGTTPRTVDYVARELYVIDDSGNVVAHSVFNIMAMWDDPSKAARFQEAVVEAVKNPADLDLRVAYHKIMHEFTTVKEIDEPITPKDYE